MVPPAMALSRIFLSATLAFSISPHCARGMAQLLTYEYIGGFSLTSCPRANVARSGAAASEHTKATLPNCLFMIFPFLWPGFWWRQSCAQAVYTNPYSTKVLCG